MIIYALCAVGGVATGVIISQFVQFFTTGEVDLSMGFAGVTLTLCLGFIGMIYAAKEFSNKGRKKKN